MKDINSNFLVWLVNMHVVLRSSKPLTNSEVLSDGRGVVGVGALLRAGQRGRVTATNLVRHASESAVEFAAGA